MRNQIIKECKEHQDLKYQVFNSSLIPDNNYRMIGVRMPILHKIAKNIIKSNPSAFLKEVKDIYYEEVMIEGLVIAQLQTEDKYTLITNYLPKITNWSLCDSFVLALKDNSEDFFKYVINCTKSNNPYTIRFGIVNMLYYYINDRYLLTILKIITKLNTEHYYVKMARAWCMAECYIKYPNETMPYLLKLNDYWVLNKSIQKIKESLRLTKDEKQYVVNETKQILNKLK
ncbi:DNA alkylation repair protein [Anaerorhabdus sp.]|jgi:3-methyladenine DNA glycosylase AlkD|uniref:DNA alkylation repair protein n=1 Tax=Anaerorhabdus sp. TaxID=1872524 RepID=UPI002FC68E74